MPDDVRDAFLRDVADAVLWWQEHAAEELRDGTPPEDVVKDAVRGVAHSLLVTLDGGTRLSDGGRLVWLTDSTGSPVGDGLHEYLFDYLDA